MPRDEIRPPFTPQRPPPVSWWKGVLKTGAPHAAAAEIQTRLAQRHPGDLYPVEIRRILNRHHVSRPQQDEILKELYSHALACFLDDDRLTDEETEYLFELRRLFDLNEDHVIDIERTLVHPHYQKRLDEVLEDERVTIDERESLEELRSALRLSPWIAHELYQESATSIVERMADRAMEDRRVSDVERRTLRELAEHLGVEIALDDARLANLYRCALMWHIESGDLPVVTDVAVRLQTNEICHLEAPATWLDWQDTKPTRRPSRPVSRIRITRGEYYRVGGFAPNVARGENMGEVDRGTLYLTSSRVLFNGSRQNLTLRFPGVLGVNLVGDLIEVEKESGRNPHFAIDGDVEVWLVALSTVLNIA